MANLLLDIKQKHAAALDGADALLQTVGARPMTTEEQTQYDGYLAEADGLEKTLKAHEKRAAISNIPSDNPASRTGLTVYENAVDKPWGYDIIKEEAEGLKARRPDRNHPYELKQWRATLATCFGDFLKSVEYGSLTQRGRSPRPIDVRLLALDDLERRASFQTPAGASEMVPSDGGFLVYPDFANEVLQLIHETGVIDPLVREVPLGPDTNAIKIPAIDERSRADGYRWGGIQAFWENEAQSLVGSKPGFNLVELVLKKLTALFYATNEVLADARALGSLAMTGFAEEIGFKLDDGIINGTGAGQLSGILNSKALITITATAGAILGIQVADLDNMWARLWPGGRKNAIWLINQDVEPALLGLTRQTQSSVANSTGIPVYLPPGAGPWGSAAATPMVNNVTLNGPCGMLYGRPVVAVEQCQTLGTVGDIILFDPTQYLMATKGGIQAASSMHVRFLTDEMTYRWIIRRDSSLWWKSAVSPAHGSNSFSPVLALSTRT